MDITYKNRKIEKVCTDAKAAERTYGREMLIKYISELMKSMRRIQLR